MGKAEDILDLLEELGEVPEELRNAIFDQKSLEVLTCWLKLAANAKTLGEFEQNRMETMEKE